MSIKISFKLKGDSDSAKSLRGGYQVAVNGERVHRYSDELPPDDAPWGPEFLGVYLIMDFVRFVEAIQDVLDQEPTLREFTSPHVAEVGMVIFFQRLSEDFVRVGAKGPIPDEVVPASKLGYLVSTENLINETVSAIDRLDSLMAENLSEEYYDSNIETFRSAQDELISMQS